MRSRIAIVVQRYGLEINGGAELHARQLAEKLSAHHDVEVLTTTALDYLGWSNHFEAGLTEINHIPVRRFKTKLVGERHIRKAHRAMTQNKKYFKILRRFGLFNWLDQRFHISEISSKDIAMYLAIQGPYCPALIRYIKNKKSRYDVFIFFTYLYYPTVVGMPLVKDKSIFIPTAHDEAPLYTLPYRELFSLPRFIMYNTEAEKQLIENTFEQYTRQTAIAGVGITPYEGDEEQLPDSLLPQSYFIYVGRIDQGKGCATMIEDFLAFYNRFPQWQSLKLVLVGNNYLDKQYEHPSILYMGFVSEGMKYTLLKNAKALIMPSRYESLSLVTLEAMAAGIPAIVNAHSEVLCNHIRHSGVGKSYSERDELFQILKYYITKDVDTLDDEAIRAKKYVSDNYSWEMVLRKFEEAINYVRSSTM